MHPVDVEELVLVVSVVADGRPGIEFVFRRVGVHFLDIADSGGDLETATTAVLAVDSLAGNRRLRRRQATESTAHEAFPAVATRSEPGGRAVSGLIGCVLISVVVTAARVGAKREIQGGRNQQHVDHRDHDSGVRHERVVADSGQRGEADERRRSGCNHCGDGMPGGV